MKHTIRKTVLLGAAFALAASSFGCSSKATTSEPEKPAAEAKTVKIGYAAPLTGDQAVYGQSMQRAIELAIKEANESQSAKDAGITFAIQASDDAADPKQAVNVANALAGDAAVVAVVGHFNSGCSIPASPVYNTAQMAMVSVSSNPQLTAQGLPNANRIVAKDDAQGTYAGDLAMKLGYKSVALLDDGSAYGQGLAAEFKKAFEAKGGKIVVEDRVQAADIDFSALVTKLKNKKPDAVYFAAAYKQGADLARQMKSAGLSVPVMGGDMLHDKKFVEVAGAKNADGCISTALGLPLDQQPKGKEFAAKYEEAYGTPPGDYDSYSYDAARIIINAVFKAGTDRAAVMNAVRTGTLSDGVTGVVAFDQNGDNKQQIISAYKVTDGEWKQLTE